MQQYLQSAETRQSSHTYRIQSSSIKRKTGFFFAHALIYTVIYVCYTVTLTITADDILYVYHDGEVALSAEAWWIAHTVNLVNACVLAIKAVDIYGVAGILASTSTGVVTDASWKCSSVEQTGWLLPGFDDAAWSQARVMARNDGSVYTAVVAGINPAARWIWSQNSSDDVVYCRKLLC